MVSKVKLQPFRSRNFDIKSFFYYHACMGSPMQFPRRSLYNCLCSKVKVKLKGLEYKMFFQWFRAVKLEPFRRSILALKVISTIMYAWAVLGSFDDLIQTIGYVPKLNWNWRPYNRAWFIFFNGFELHVELEPFRSSHVRTKRFYY